jgi:hypothetical protein
VKDMDCLQASWVIWNKIGMFNQPDSNTICLLTGAIMAIPMLTVKHDLVIRICFRNVPRDVLNQTSPNILSAEVHSFYI